MKYWLFFLIGMTSTLTFGFPDVGDRVIYVGKQFSKPDNISAVFTGYVPTPDCTSSSTYYTREYLLETYNPTTKTFHLRETLTVCQQPRTPVYYEVALQDLPTAADFETSMKNCFGPHKSVVNLLIGSKKVVACQFDDPVKPLTVGNVPFLTIYKANLTDPNFYTVESLYDFSFGKP